jgi:AcrR family transcriptional regulator
MENDGEMELAAVAERAGVSPGLPYRYFDSKSALVVAVVDSLFDQFEEQAYLPDFSELADDWWEREKIRTRKLVDIFYEEPLAAYVFSQLAGDAAVVQARQTRMNRQVKGVSKNLKTGQRTGHIPAGLDTELAAASMLGGIHQTLQSALGQEPRLDKARVIEWIHEFQKHTLQIQSND